MKKKYILVNVFGHNGYSFVVYGELDENHESDVIQACIDNDLFQEAEDSEYCSVVEADDYDIQHFDSCGCLYEI